MKGKKLYESPDLMLNAIFNYDCVLASAQIDTGADGGALNEDGFGNNWLG